jgi:hypothetical protein
LFSTILLPPQKQVSKVEVGALTVILAAATVSPLPRRSGGGEGALSPIPGAHHVHFCGCEASTETT